MQNNQLVKIDGSLGEGGGQVVRTSLTLSALTGRPIHIVNIRANRSTPGLRHQHLTALNAVGEICGAAIQGAELGSREILFEPDEIHSGEYAFRIPTAGSASLVLQTVFYPLAAAENTSTVEVTGGTHVPWSPCFHYLSWQWLPALRKIGYQAELTLKRCGYYPQGGGKLTAAIHPVGEISALQMQERGAIKQVGGLSAVSNLPEEIARRQRRRLVHRVGAKLPLNDLKVQTLPAVGKGTFLAVLMEYEHSTAVFFSLGAKGKRAELVGDEAADQLIAHHRTKAPLDPYLGDQILLPLSLAEGPSQLQLSRITMHLRTNAAVIAKFLPVEIDILGEIDQPGEVRITPRQ